MWWAARTFYCSGVRRALLIAALVTLTLTGCTDTGVTNHPLTLTESASPTPPAPSGSPSPVPTTQITPAYSQHQTGPGCPRTRATTPKTAMTARVGDIDGDGRADIEWAYMRSGSGTLYFGVTTASGATISTSQDFASGADRRVVIGRLRDGAVIALPSDHHGIPLYTFASCSFHRPYGVNGKPYEFGQADLQGDGIGAACRSGQLVGLQNPRRGNTRALTATTVIVEANGRTAVNGATTTLLTNLDKHPSADQQAQSPTCGGSPVLTLD